MWSERVKFVRFTVVGLGNTIVDFVVFFLLTLIGVSNVFAQLCSYSAGVINSYVWNRTWTFRVREKVSAQQLFQFIVVNMTSLSATMILLTSSQLMDIGLFISKMMSTIVGMAINFVGSCFWVFSTAQKTAEGSSTKKRACCSNESPRY
ncbi:GtrA family protein [Anoxybacillus sp. ST4]|uniref:GtrA family protein n=1 Tax=Anoxybacillus sp. ST4 TaxID=2864181 RepID=UPI001C63C062|nr:GtrA family protein [Anoxybacillus sp. ST4]MBW7652183.1 GtrA family protein [Anoxybacillus sp. ST4]